MSVRVPSDQVAVRLGTSTSPLPLAALTPYIELCHPDPFFVSPTLRITGSLDSSPVLLISAGAAVGKSTLARAIAASARAVYFDLSQINVGSSSYQGLLLAAFGADHISSAVRAIESGQLALVFDALDEAQARAGDANFQAFLRDFTEHSRLATDKISAVFLGRPETVDRVRAFFQGDGVTACLAEVDYFEPQQAALFVDRELDRRHEQRSNAPHRRFGAPFQDAKNALIRFLSETITASGWGEEVVRSFLGYAPVLQGLAAFLDGDNYYSMVERLTRSGTTDETGLRLKRSPWAALPVIVEHLLEREQEKFATAARGRFEHLAAQVGFSSWAQVYSQQEQLLLVAEHVEGSGATPPPSILPESLHGEYQDLLSWLLPQHPFVGPAGYANVLFLEYTRAWHLAQSEGLGSPSALDRLPPQYMPSPMLAHLTLLLQVEQVPTSTNQSASISGREWPVLPARQFGLWYESFTSIHGTAHEGLPWLDVWPWEDTSRSAGRIFDPALGLWFHFQVATDRDSLCLHRRLSNADIEVSSGIELQSDDGTFHVGPDVRLVGEWLKLNACELLVRTGDRGVQLEALLFEPPPGSVTRIRVDGSGGFLCHWPGLEYPWRQYGWVNQVPDAYQYTRQHVSEALIKILASFRPAGSWSADIEGVAPLDYYAPIWAVRSHDVWVGQALRALLEERLLSYRNIFFRLRAQRLEAAGLSMSAAVGSASGDYDPEARARLVELVSQRVLRSAGTGLGRARDK